MVRGPVAVAAQLSAAAVALEAVAAAAVAPGGGGGFRGGGMAVAPGGGGGFRGGGVAVAPGGGGGFRGGGVAVAPGVDRGFRPGAVAGAGVVQPGVGGGRVAGGGYHGGGYRHHHRHRHGGFWPGVAVGVGIGSTYGYYGSPSYYDDSYGYYDDGVVAAAPPAGDDAVAYCMQRYRSYDPASGTYLGNDGLAASLPGAIARYREFEGRRIPAPPLSFQNYARSATATPPSVNTSAAISRRPSGSCSIAAAASTPTTGTSKVPIEAVAAGSRSSAANQHT